MGEVNFYKGFEKEKPPQKKETHFNKLVSDTYCPPELRNHVPDNNQSDLSGNYSIDPWSYR